MQLRRSRACTATAQICICASAKTAIESWAFIYRYGGRQREAGLGKAGKGGVSLASARREAAKGRALLEQKPPVDPLTVWRAPPDAAVPTFARSREGLHRLARTELEERQARTAMAQYAGELLQAAHEAACRPDRCRRRACGAAADLDSPSGDRQPFAGSN